MLSDIAPNAPAIIGMTLSHVLQFFQFSVNIQESLKKF